MKPGKISVGITGLNATDNPGSGIPVIRALRESKLFELRVIGLCYETLEPGIYLHGLVDKTYQIPLPSEGTEKLMARLAYIQDKEKLDVIIPNFDSELFNFIKIADALRRQLNIHTFLPSPEQFEARQKANLADFGKEHGIKVPQSKNISRPQDVETLSDEFEYPLVVKGKFYDAVVTYNDEQALAAFHRISSKWGLPVIIQEFIQGEEVNVTALGDGTGQVMGLVPMRKQYITDKGKAWSGISIDDPELLSIAGGLIRSTKWRGGMELEMIRTDKEEYFLLEINPRFPAWIFLAVGCGQNHPEALVRMALGETVEPFSEYETGKLFVRYSYDLIVGLDEYAKISTQGEL
jgi:carbamoyl-phosphate synthase large subunit